MEHPNVVIMAGPNGAGKSTLSKSLLQGALGIRHYVNADALAKGLSAFNFDDMAFKAGKHCAHPGERRSCLQTQDKARAALRASVLRQQEDARSAPLRRSAVAEPRRQRYARDVLRRNASQIQHDCTESTCLQQQIGDPQCLFDPRPGLCRAG